MAQTLYRINDNNLRYLIDLQYAALADSAMMYRKFFIGEPVQMFDMLKLEVMQDLICHTEISECEKCIISSQLDMVKCDELRL